MSDALGQLFGKLRSPYLEAHFRSLPWVPWTAGLTRQHYLATYIVSLTVPSTPGQAAQQIVGAVIDASVFDLLLTDDDETIGDNCARDLL